MNKKSRVLMVSEFSGLFTGYSVYTRNLLSRLYNTGKYDIAELACYGDTRNPKCYNFPWTIYGNLPANEQEQNEYNSTPINQFGKYNFGHVVLDFKPDAVCVPPNSLVLTINGYLPIQNIKIGDYVMTHKNRFRKVTKLYKKQYNGKMQSIFINGNTIPLLITPEHPIYTYQYKRQTFHKKSVDKIYQDETPSFLPAKELKVKQLIIANSEYENQEIINIDLRNYLSQFYENDGFIYPTYSHRRYHVPSIIQLSEDFARLLGYIISDGYIAKTGINITFGEQEMEFAKDAQNIIKTIFGIKCRIVTCKDKRAIAVYANSRILSQFLKSYIKWHNIPKEIWLSSKKIRENIICGLVRGDGCYEKNDITFCSCDKILANNFRAICLSVGILTSISKHKTNHGVAYIVHACGIYAEAMHNIVHKKSCVKNLKSHAIRRPRRTHKIDNNVASSIRRIRTYDYHGQVYNLEVEDDNSYVVNHTIVHNCSITDFWMWDYIPNHSLSPYFNFIVMPAIDSYPSQEGWLDQMMRADRVLCYSEYGQRVIEKQTDKIKVCGVPSSGVGQAFQPIMNKKELREKFGLSSKAFIVGMVSRNQKRKLFPDLIEGFAQFLKQRTPTEASNTFLYLHTSYPDLGWDIPRLIKQSGCGNNILLTYVCTQCKAMLPLPFNDARRVCPVCSSPSMIMPNTQMAISDEQLNEVYNLMDIHIQYAICEGLGLSSIEAAACATPIASVDYSAMSDVCDHCNGYKIRVQRTFLEAETGQYRCYPDNAHLVEILNSFYKLPQAIRFKRGRDALIGCKQFYNWDRASKIWEQTIDSLQSRNNWDASPRLHTPSTQIPQLNDSEMFVRWAVANVLGKPELMNSYFAHRLIRDLNYGASTRQTGGVYLNEDSQFGQHARFRPFGPKEIIQELTDLCNENNYWEQLRCGLRQESPRPCIMMKKPDEGQIDG